jgi:HD superfamily phosphohydrolase
MRVLDRVYGAVLVDDAGILGLIGCPTFQRLQGIRQAGPSALAFSFKDVTRFEHSLGVFALLRRLRAPRREQIAGLLHDISHTAFSHAVDFVFASEEQDHHEQLKPLMLERPDLVQALASLGYSPHEFYDDSIYPLLEQPIPWLCADRLDYFLRDGLACGVVTSEFIGQVLGSLAVVDKKIVLRDVEVARQAAALFATMNREWWASPTEAFIYNEFADALREGLRLGVLQHDDLMTEDQFVLAKLDASGSRKITKKLQTIRALRPESTEGYVPRIVPKERWLDPPVLAGGVVQRLSELDAKKRRSRRAV